LTASAPRSFQHHTFNAEPHSRPTLCARFPDFFAATTFNECSARASHQQPPSTRSRMRPRSIPKLPAIAERAATWHTPSIVTRPHPRDPHLAGAGPGAYRATADFEIVVRENPKPRQGDRSPRYLGGHAGPERWMTMVILDYPEARFEDVQCPVSPPVECPAGLRRESSLSMVRLGVAPPRQCRADPPRSTGARPHGRSFMTSRA
jgi:hypothetical protein